MPIKTLIVDDHTLFREGLRRVLDHEPDIEVVGEASDARTALELVDQFRPLDADVFLIAALVQLQLFELHRIQLRARDGRGILGA